jgi:hypothetical protein
MRRLPSVKTLENAFPGKGKALREALLMNRAQLSEHPAGKSRIAECCYHPACYDIRMHVLDFIAGCHGVEYVASDKDTFTTASGFDYLNVGDSYVATIVRSRETGNYRVACIGDIVERGGYI